MSGNLVRRDFLKCALASAVVIPALRTRRLIGFVSLWRLPSGSTWPGAAPDLAFRGGRLMTR
jgi:hypothetical protein